MNGSVAKEAGGKLYGISVTNVHENTAQDLITITEDRLELRLRDYKGAVEAKRDLIGPAGIVLTLIVTLATATFTDTLGIPEHYIRAGFVLITLASVVWLCVAAIKSRRAGDASVKNLIATIRK